MNIKRETHACIFASNEKEPPLTYEFPRPASSQRSAEPPNPDPSGQAGPAQPAVSVPFRSVPFPYPPFCIFSLSTKTNIYQLTVPVHSVGGHGGNVLVLLYTRGGNKQGNMVGSVDAKVREEAAKNDDDGGKGYEPSRRGKQ